MDAEQQQQQQQQQQQPQQHHHQQQQKHSHQSRHHHVHCSYEKDIVCDETQSHQQRHDEQHSLCYAHAYADHTPTQTQTPSTPHRHQQPRKHSHSPHPSRHTSPHSHHSHSLHSSPHQSHHHVHEHSNETHPRPSTLTQSSLVHAHHHHHRRRKRHNGHQPQMNGGSGGGSGNSSIRGGTHGHSHQERSTSWHKRHGSSCTRRHRSATDVSSTSINTCHDPLCTDREVQEIFVRKSCCSSSRTELAQYFAEDLYGTSRRPSSCCTSSDYCYQTDSTSLYGSRSSLSRNNSIKSASVTMRKKRLHQRQPSYTSISLRALNADHGHGHTGSLTTMFDRAKQIGANTADGIGGSGTGSGKLVIVSPSKVTIERQTSKDALSNELPEYACSPSPIRWSFLADGKSPTEFENTGAGDSKDTRKPEAAAEQKHDSNWKSTYDDRPSTSASARKRRDGSFSRDFEETSTTVLFHQEGEAFNNCCSNYIQCNTYLDQDLQITSEDIHQYLSKGNRQIGDVLNNSKSYPFQPSNALEFQYKNNFANNNAAGSSEGGDSVRGFDDRFRRNSSKETNLNQNSSAVASVDTNTGRGAGGCAASSCSSSTPLSPANINLSSSTNNINIVFNACLERNANEVKFINTVRSNVVSAEAHHAGYLPYTYPTYDYTNMSANSLFDKTLGIDELPKEFAKEGGVECNAGSCSTTASEGQHSSALHSPTPAGVSFESFDAASSHNLLSQRGSCQFSPTSSSPLSRTSLASSPLPATVNPAAAFQHARYSYTTATPPTSTQRSHSHNHSQYHHHHFTENFRLRNAFKRVRKRARKYTDFLRKK